MAATLQRSDAASALHPRPRRRLARRRRSCGLRRRLAERRHPDVAAAGGGRSRSPRAMWAAAPATFHGEHYRIEGAVCLPRPEPPPPIMIGTERAEGASGSRPTCRLVDVGRPRGRAPTGDRRAAPRDCEEIGTVIRRDHPHLPARGVVPGRSEQPSNELRAQLLSGPGLRDPRAVSGRSDPRDPASRRSRRSPLPDRSRGHGDRATPVRQRNWFPRVSSPGGALICALW